MNRLSKTGTSRLATVPVPMADAVHIDVHAIRFDGIAGTTRLALPIVRGIRIPTASAGGA